MDFRAYKLSTIESNFKKTLNAAGRQFKASSGEFPGVVRLTSVDTKGFYCEEKATKEKIALHGTAGVLHGDLWALSQNNNHVSVSYVVARDGTIYQLFPDEYWSYHLGGNSSISNSYWSKHTVAIEVSNLLGLVESKIDPNLLFDTYLKPYCTKADKDFYTELPVPYRGYRYWAKFTDAQYDSLNSLLKNLGEKFKLPITHLPADQAYNFFPGVVPTSLFMHTNCRKDKIDFSPSFDISRIGQVVSVEDANVAPGVSLPTGAPNPGVFITAPASKSVIVKAGDTIWGIAKSHNVSPAALIKVNPGIDPNKIQVGQEIKLP